MNQSPRVFSVEVEKNTDSYRNKSLHEKVQMKEKARSLEQLIEDAHRKEDLKQAYWHLVLYGTHPTTEGNTR